jgi:hypothetical protein
MAWQEQRFLLDNDLDDLVINDSKVYHRIHSKYVYVSHALERYLNAHIEKVYRESAYNNRQHGSPIRRLRFWIAELVRPKLPEQINNGVR